MENFKQKNLPKLNQKTAEVFEKLIEGMEFREDGGYRKIKNPPFMDLTIEKIGDASLNGDEGTVIAFTHWGEMNGDLMRGPDVTFLRIEGMDPDTSDTSLKVCWHPLSFRNDYVGVNDEPVDFEDGKVTGFNSKRVRDIASFCNTWANNLKAYIQHIEK